MVETNKRQMWLKLARNAIFEKDHVQWSIDEVKIQEDLIVYDKHGRTLHGFVNLGNVNEQLQVLEGLQSRPHGR